MTLLALTAAADYYASGGQFATPEDAQCFVFALIVFVAIGLVMCIGNINKGDKTNNLETGGTK